MSQFIVHPAAAPLRGSVSVPGDKSIGHRSLMFGALSSTPVRVTGLSAGADNASTRSAMQALGVSIDTDPQSEDGAVIVHGVGVDGFRAPTSAIDCGNSGTTMRLLCGLLGGQLFASELTGDASLVRRPMRRVVEPLGRMGCDITGNTGPKSENVYPPLAIAGRDPSGWLQAIEYTLPMASAQVKSAVLLGGLYANGLTRVIEPGPTRDHTERMLAHMGAPLRVLDGGVIELDTRGWNRRLAMDSVAVPGDPSSAAFVIAAALLAGAERVSVADVCTNATRTGFLTILASMNARVELEARRHEGGDSMANLVVSRGAGDDLRGTVIEGDVVVRAIDELPILAVIAARCGGVTEVRDAGELRVKESDRIAATCAMLRALDVVVEERPDGMLIEGDPTRDFAAARIDAKGDHRIAMSAAVAGLVARGPVTIDDVDNVATSFPRFAELMGSLGARIEHDSVSAGS